MDKNDNLEVIMMFVLMSLADTMLTCNCLAFNLLGEANVAIVFLAKAARISICSSIFAVKSVSILLAIWLLYVHPYLLKKGYGRNIGWKSWSREETPRRAVMILTMITALTGVIPGLAGNVLLIV